jgi:predicted small lipoprotein YifL
MRFVIMVGQAALLVLALTACGKLGPPQPPGPAEKVIYPHAYPSPHPSNAATPAPAGAAAGIPSGAFAPAGTQPGAASPTLTGAPTPMPMH